jgi:hypothetical protein
MTATIGDGVVFTVEIGFATTSGNGLVPLGGNLTDIVWTDVSAYVRSVATKRGRSSELDGFTAGSANVTLSNATRVFDPEYSSGPYFGKITPGRPIRVSAQYAAGATTPLFFGFVESWDQQYVHPSDAVCVVTCSDAFKVLNQLTLPHYWEYYIGTESPTAWFRFDDGDAPTSAFDSVAQAASGVWRNSTGAPGVGASGTSLLANDSGLAATFDGTTYLGLPLGLFPYNLYAKTFSLEFWVSTSTTTDGQYGIFQKGANENTIAVGMVVAGGVGTIQAHIGSTPGISQIGIDSSNVVVNDGNRHHIVLVSFDDGINPVRDELWVDGVLATTTTSYVTITTTYFEAMVGSPFSQTVLAAYNFPLPFVGSVDELVYYAGDALSSADIAIHRQIGRGLYGAGNFASTRAAEVLTMAQWMTDARDITAPSASTVQARNTQGKTVLASLQECEAAEQGRLFINAAGKVRFISRLELSTNSAYNVPSRIYGDSTGELPYLDIAFVYNDQLIKNLVTVSRANGATATAQDTSSQGQYFVRSDSLTDLITNSDDFSADLANARLAFYKQPSTRVETLTITPRANPADLYPAVIGDEIGTRVTVNRRPQGVGAAVSKELMIEGIAHSISADGWVTTYNCSPAPTVFFVLDSASFGVLDTDLLGY